VNLQQVLDHFVSPWPALKGKLNKINRQMMVGQSSEIRLLSFICWSV